MRDDLSSDLPGDIGRGESRGLCRLADRFGVRIDTAFNGIVHGLPAAKGRRVYHDAMKRRQT